MVARIGSLAILVMLEGCCLNVVSGGTGNYEGSSSSTGTSGGSLSASTGTSTGRPILDAGTCLIDGFETVEAGTWEGLGSYSCMACNPAANPNGWTTLDVGEVCEVMAWTGVGPAVANTPVTGRCSLSGLCAVSTAGGSCNDQLGCPGGFCNDAGLCEVNQNLGWFNSCRGVGVLLNACAEGPCCMDAGYTYGVEDGGGWCCGLIDGGVHTCLTTDQVCYAISDCCDGLSCIGTNGVQRFPPNSDSDAGYGFCFPN